MQERPIEAAAMLWGRGHAGRGRRASDAGRGGVGSAAEDGAVRGWVVLLLLLLWRAGEPHPRGAGTAAAPRSPSRPPMPPGTRACWRSPFTPGLGPAPPGSGERLRAGGEQCCSVGPGTSGPGVGTSRCCSWPSLSSDARPGATARSRPFCCRAWYFTASAVALRCPYPVFFVWASYPSP